MPAGKIKFYDAKKGYGFLSSDEGGDTFVHVSAIKDAGLPPPHEGERFTFDTAMGPKGSYATNLAKA